MVVCHVFSFIFKAEWLVVAVAVVVVAVEYRVAGGVADSILSTLVMSGGRTEC